MKVKRLKRVTRKKRTLRKKVYKGGSTSEIPIFIICWNQYTYVKSMVEQLQKLNLDTKIFIIDNKSTYEPLVKYLANINGKNGVEILYQPENYGHTVYERPDIYERGGDMYIVTDPDLTLNPNMPKNFREIMAKISETHKANKVGVALDITNNIDVSKKLDGKPGTTFATNEAKYWTDSINDPKYKLYRAPIDSTFALINKKYRMLGSMENSIRIGGDFTAVHRPWTINYEKDLLPGEIDFYLNNKNNKSTTLNRWSK